MLGLIPRLSIVTVNRNDATGLARTIESVISQTWRNYEYIVIDGASTDGSVEVLKRYSDWIDHWVSEPDAGIYDAMNKGLQLARGEFVCFMNAGDTFDHAALERVFARLGDRQSVDVIYGDMRNSTRGTVDRGRDTKDILVDMPFRHQAAIVRTDLHRTRPFDTRYRVAADYHFVLRAVDEGRVFSNSGVCFGDYDATGASNSRYFSTIGEYVRILYRSRRGTAGASRVIRYLWGKKKFMAYLVAKRLLGDSGYAAVVGRVKGPPAAEGDLLPHPQNDHRITSEAHEKTRKTVLETEQF